MENKIFDYFNSMCTGCGFKYSLKAHGSLPHKDIFNKEHGAYELDEEECPKCNGCYVEPKEEVEDLTNEKNNK